MDSDIQRVHGLAGEILDVAQAILLVSISFPRSGDRWRSPLSRRAWSCGRLAQL